MHTDERVDLKNEFIQYLNDRGWENYQNLNKKITFRVNFLFRLFYILIVISIFALGAFSMKDYISRDWLWFSFGLVIVWLIIERTNIAKIDDLFLKKERKKLISSLVSDDKFLSYIKLFEKLDILPVGFNESFNKNIELNNDKELIEKIKKTLYFLNFIKTFEDMNSGLFTNEKERLFEPLD